ncbi:DNA-binding domain-containing protein, AraC-type [Phyllobacterium sp. YR531]|nr:DNA-binding domain-containing protein, AraC-type [Phyllobacterium sp. YR531]
MSKPETLVSVSQMTSAIRNALNLSNDPHIGLRLGLGMRITTYGVYGFALLSSPTCRAACQFAQKYHALTLPMSDQLFTETNTHGIWSTEPNASMVSDLQLYIFKVEHILGTIIAFAKDIIGDFQVAAIRLRYPEPSDSSTYRQVFNCPILYGQPANELMIDTALLDRTPRHAHESTFSAVQRLCDDMLGKMATSSGVAGRLREIFMESAGRFPPIEMACEHLGISARTLRRRLASEGVSYQTVLDETRLNLAKRYLLETGLTMEEIASRLNYSDASNFRHAFRRWTGKSPVEFRTG